jgi:hypothetical protein
MRLRLVKLALVQEWLRREFGVPQRQNDRKRWSESLLFWCQGTKVHPREGDVAAPMPPGEGSAPPGELELRKLGLEVQKLQGEVRQLRFPITWLTGLLTVIISVFGVGLQCARSGLDSKEAEIKKSQAELDLRELKQEAKDQGTQLEGTRKRVSAAIVLAKAELDSLKRERDDLQAQLLLANRALGDARQGLAATPSVDSAQAALATASRVVSEVGSALQQAGRRATQTRDTLDVIQTEIAAPGGLSAGSPVIVTLELPAAASVKYRRWISRDVVNDLGNFDAGKHNIKMPYGGYMYFEATYSSTGKLELQSAYCKRDCTVAFKGP